MAQAARLSLRMQKELRLLLTDPPPGARLPLLSSDSDLSSLTSIDADIKGPDGTVYENGVFRVKIQIPERYPFQPPNVTFATPIYHPNIDNGGRICLDILNLPPKGAWQPSLNISTVITSIGLLLSEPNPDDGLMCEASKEYKYNRQAFDQKARFMIQKYAKAAASGSSSSVQLKSLSSCPSTKTDGPETLVESQDAHCSKTTQKKSWGLRKKLSLESSISGSKGSTDMEVNEILPDTEPGDLDHGGANNNFEKENSVNEKKMEKTDQVKQGNYGCQKESAAENTLILQMGTKKEPCVQSTPSESSYTCQIKKEDLTDKENRGFADTKCEKLGSRSRKLSLGLEGPFQKFEVDNSKENRLPIQKLRLSRPRGTFGIGEQFSLSPLSDLQEVNEWESRLIQSQKGSIDVLKLKREEKPLDEDDCYYVRDAREDVVIVLDSEGSDEEENRCSRRGGLLTRKRMRRSNLKLPTVT